MIKQPVQQFWTTGMLPVRPPLFEEIDSPPALPPTDPRVWGVTLNLEPEELDRVHLQDGDKEEALDHDPWGRQCHGPNGEEKGQEAHPCWLQCHIDEQP